TRLQVDKVAELCGVADRDGGVDDDARGRARRGGKARVDRIDQDRLRAARAWVRCRVVVGLVAGEVCAHLPRVPAGGGWAERARAGAPALTRLALGPAAQLLVGVGEDRSAGAVGLCRRLGGERPEEL